MYMRINKYLASCGYGSRRKVEELILSGRVYVNGVRIEDLGHTIQEGVDKVQVDQKQAALEDRKVYYMMHKPQGYLCTVKDDRGRPTVLQLVKGIKERIYPVGRLDFNTTGLLILTNDGELTYQLTHPTKHISKTYEVKTKYPLRVEQKRLFQKGVNIGDYVTRPAIVEQSQQVADKFFTRITIFEGKNRQIRRMFEVIGLQILELKRIAIGHLELGDLPVGKMRKLTEKEVELLKKSR